MLKNALLRYRITTYIVGALLIVLTYGTILKYANGDDRIVATVGMLHGFLYMVFLVITADLARRARFSFKFTILIMLAGTVPGLSFVAERFATRKVRARMAEQQQELVETA
jgi:integral membrane protein